MDMPHMRTAPDLPGCPFQLNGVEIPVDQWNVDHGGYLGSEAPVRVQLTFFARFEPEPETAEQQAERLKAEQAAALAEAVDHWTMYRERYYAGQPLLLAVLDIHQPEGGYKQAICAHCEQSDGMESTENVPWPCATYSALTAGREQVAEAGGCADECGPVEMGGAVEYEVPEGGIRSRYDVLFQPDEIKAVRAAADAAGKTTTAYLHDLAVKASAPVTVNITVQGSVASDRDIADAVRRHLRLG